MFSEEDDELHKLVRQLRDHWRELCEDKVGDGLRTFSQQVHRRIEFAGSLSVLLGVGEELHRSNQFLD